MEFNQGKALEFALDMAGNWLKRLFGGWFSPITSLLGDANGWLSMLKEPIKSIFGDSALATANDVIGSANQFKDGITTQLGQATDRALADAGQNFANANGIKLSPQTGNGTPAPTNLPPKPTQAPQAGK